MISVTGGGGSTMCSSGCPYCDVLWSCDRNGDAKTNTDGS